MWWLPVAIVAVSIGVAGFAKLLAPATPAASIAAALHLPTGRSWRTAIRLHPIIEVVIALTVLLAPGRPAAVAGTAALSALTAAYLGIVIRARRRGAGLCPCFGPLGSGRLTRWTVLRNAGLLAGAVWGLVHAASGSTPTPTGRWGWLGVATILVLTAIALAAIARRRGSARLDAEVEAALRTATGSGPGSGPAAPAVRLRLSPDCGPCRYLRRRLGESGAAGRVTLLDAARGDRAPVAEVIDTAGAVLAQVDDPAAIDALLTRLGRRTQPDSATGR